MTLCKRQMSVACRLSDAFEYIADWNNFKNFLPQFIDLKPVSVVQYGPGASFETTMLLGKLEVVVVLDVVEFVKNTRITMKTSRGLKAKLHWEFKEAGGKTLLYLNFDYELPPGLAVSQAERDSIARDLEDSTCRSLELLKWILESMPKKTEDEEF